MGHRPCGFATTKIDAKGKIKKVYNLYRTPFDALLGHPRASEFLKDGVSCEKLDILAHQQSDAGCAPGGRVMDGWTLPALTPTQGGY